MGGFALSIFTGRRLAAVNPSVGLAVPFFPR